MKRSLLTNVPATLLFLTITIFLASCGDKNSKTEQVAPTGQDTLLVKVITVQPDTFIEYGTYYGRLAPVNEAKVICYSGGRVETLRAAEGDFVKEGESLAAIDSSKAITSLKIAQLQEKIALANLEQTKKHLKDGNASSLSVDRAELDYLNARNIRIDAQKNCRGALAITPLSGIVTLRSVNLYQELVPGQATFTVSQTTTMKISVSTVESEAILVTTGSSAEITSPLYPQKLWYGTVKSVAREASDDNKTFRTEITVKNSDGLLKPGATATVRLHLKRHSDALFVPTELVRTDGVQHSVMIVDDNNRAISKLITPGAQSDSLTLIMQGLAVGDRVISYGNQLALDGMPVRIITHGEEQSNRGTAND